MSRLTAEVGFYDKTSVKVAMTKVTDSDEARAAEIKLLCFYIGHVLADLGRGEFAEEALRPLRLKCGGNGPELPDGVLWDAEGWPGSGKFVRVGSASGEAKPRFVAALETHGSVNDFREQSSTMGFFALNSQNDWRLKMRGMLFSGSSGPTYCAASVYALLDAVLARRPTETEFEARLLAAARCMFFSFEVGGLRLPSLWTLFPPEAAAYGWFGTRPRFLAEIDILSWDPVGVGDSVMREHWYEKMGRRSFSEVPDDELPF